MEKPVINDLEEIFAEKIVFLRVNETESPDIVQFYNVTGFPTLVVINPILNEYEVVSGFKEKNKLLGLLNYASGKSALNIECQNIGGFFTLAFIRNFLSSISTSS